MSRNTVGDCEEYVAKALWSLSIGRGALPSRLSGAASCIAVLDEKDFPDDLRADFAKIKGAVTTAGSYEHTVSRMSADQAEGVARDIFELAIEVERRYAIETR